MDGIRERLSAEAGRIKAFSAYTDRLCPAADTVRRLRPRFGEFGITRLAETTGLDCIGIPVWAAVRPNARTLSVCQGKGIDVDAAQASAVMEAMEVATAERDDLASRTCSASDIAGAGGRFLFLETLLRRGKAVPAMDERLAWLEGFDLLADAPVWLPAEAVTLDHTDTESRYWRSTDGLASGNLLIEAVLHGLCERVERDAAALWLLAPEREVQARCIDPQSFDDEVLTGLAHKIEKANLHLRLFDITSDVGVPVFFATVSRQRDGSEANWVHFDLASGSGCHPLPVRAALRAVTEAVQSRLTIISGARDDFAPSVYARKIKTDLLIYLSAEPALKPPPAAPPIRGPGAYIGFILDRLRDVGARSAIVVPLQAEDDHFAVVKAVVPDLESPPGDRQARIGRRGLAAMMRLQ